MHVDWLVAYSNLIEDIGISQDSRIGEAIWELGFTIEYIQAAVDIGRVSAHFGKYRSHASDFPYRGPSDVPSPHFLSGLRIVHEHQLSYQWSETMTENFEALQRLRGG